MTDEPEDAAWSSGDAYVDCIASALDALGSTPVGEHASRLLEVHDRLSGELAPERALRGAGDHGAS